MSERQWIETANGQPGDTHSEVMEDLRIDASDSHTFLTDPEPDTDTEENAHYDNMADSLGGGV